MPAFFVLLLILTTCAAAQVDIQAGKKSGRLPDSNPIPLANCWDTTDCTGLVQEFSGPIGSTHNITLNLCVSIKPASRSLIGQACTDLDCAGHCKNITMETCTVVPTGHEYFHSVCK